MCYRPNLLSRKNRVRQVQGGRHEWRRRPGLSPSLFPFLAVLVCTLGTLILLLALVAQNATDAAEQQKAGEAAKLAASEHAVPRYRPTPLT